MERKIGQESNCPIIFDEYTFYVHSLLLRAILFIDNNAYDIYVETNIGLSLDDWRESNRINLKENSKGEFIL